MMIVKMMLDAKILEMIPEFTPHLDAKVKVMIIVPVIKARFKPLLTGTHNRIKLN